MTTQPLGEAAILIRLPDEPTAVRFAHHVRRLSPEWLEDVVPAYATVGIYFDPLQIDSASAEAWIRKFTPPDDRAETESREREFAIPVCYELGIDWPAVEAQLKLPREEIIVLHTGVEFTVHAIGFVPGFPYLGYLPPELCGVPRLSNPRTRVEPGSVGITGRQTGIYPSAKPGGWPLIGRTPWTIVDVADGFFPLRVGDRISFVRIDETQYHQLNGQRLTERR